MDGTEPETSFGAHETQLMTLVSDTYLKKIIFLNVPYAHVQTQKVKHVSGK